MVATFSIQAMIWPADGADLVVGMGRQHQRHALYLRPLGWHWVLVLLATQVRTHTHGSTMQLLWTTDCGMGVTTFEIRGKLDV